MSVYAGKRNMVNGSPPRGFFAVGVDQPKCEINIGTLWRTAHILGAAYLFTIGKRYRRQPSDTTKAWTHLPLIHWDTADDMRSHLPLGDRLVGVELADEAVALPDYEHWQQSVYLLGAEDRGISADVLSRCHDVVKLPGSMSMNVAVAGSIVMYDRIARGARRR